MPKKIKQKKKDLSRLQSNRGSSMKSGPKKKEEIEELKANLEKTGEALGDLFKGIFKGVGRVLEVAKDMEEKGEEVRSYKKEIKGVTESGKKYRGEAGWKIGFLDALLGRKKTTTWPPHPPIPPFRKKEQGGPPEKK